MDNLTREEQYFISKVGKEIPAFIYVDFDAWISAIKSKTEYMEKLTVMELPARVLFRLLCIWEIQNNKIPLLNMESN